MSVVKRAYRKRPVLGVCPSPEIHWGEFQWTQLQMLEDMLRFFHVTCKKLVEAVTWPELDQVKDHDRVKYLGNADCCR